jgi:hypothetical protein
MDTAARRGVAVVFNANHADRIGGVYDIAPNVANLMAGRPLRPPSGDRHYRDKMVQIGLLLAGLGAWTFWSFLKVHRWSAGRKPLPSGLGYGFFLAAPLAIEAVAAGALVAAVPVKLSVAILHAPDLMMGLGFAGLLLLGWAAIRTAWVIALKVRATPPAPPVRVSGRQMVA